MILREISRLIGHNSSNTNVVFLRRFSVLLIVALLTSIVPAVPALAQSSQPVYSLPECEQVEEKLLLSELNSITRSVFEEGKSGLNVVEIVDRNWAELEMDSVVDASVDEAAEKILDTEGLWDRIKSGWHPPTAQRFTEKVVELAFDSPRFRVSVDKLSQRIVDDLSVEIEIMTAISASSSLLCMQEFIGTTFSETMALYLEKDIEKWLRETTGNPEVPTDVSDALKGRSPSLVGVGLIIATQIARLLAKNVTHQIVGKIVARIIGKAAGTWIPVVGWVIGGALIVWDLVLLDKGSVPQIREALKKEDVKQEVRTQIAAAVEEELDTTLPTLAESVTLDMYGQWNRFLQSFELVLRLAEKNVRFRAIVDSVTSDQVEKLRELVSVGTEALGTDWLVRIIENGKFEQIRALPQDSFEVLRATANPDLVLDWADFSGDEIVNVVETELYKVSSPSDIGDFERLKEVLALEDPSAIRRLMQFAGANRSSLLRLRTVQTKWLLTELTDDDLVWTSSFLADLDGPAAEGLVDYAMRESEFISVLRGSQELQSKLPGLLALADSNVSVQTILDDTTAEQVQKLADLVAIARESLEPDVLTAVIEEGQFEAILALPRAAFLILKESKDASVVIAWAALAGQALRQVVETRLFIVATPSSFDGNVGLSRVLALEEHESIRKLMQLDRAGRDVLIELPTVQAKAVLDAFSEKDLSWLAGYLQNIQEKDRGLISAYILQKPDVLPNLQSSEEFQSNFPLVLTLAESDLVFLALLTDTRVDDVEKLSNLVAVATSSMSPEQVAASIETGKLRLLLSLPEVTLEILKEKKDPAIVLGWADLAGDDIERVVKTELYRVASTADFSGRDALKKVLALENPAVIRKLMQMHRIERVVLLGLATERVRSVVSFLSTEDLSWLALYLADMAADIKDPLVEFVLKDQGLIPFLKNSEGLRNKLPRVLLLAVDIPKFEEILNRLNLDEVEKLSQLVSAADATLGPEEIAQMIETGQFEAIFKLTQVTFEILRVTGSPKLVLDWAELAGEAIARVVETGLYLVSSPSEFHGREELDKVLAIEDPVAIQSLMNLDQEERKQLLELHPEEARTALLSDLSKDNLSWLAEYLPDLPGAEQHLLVYHVVRAPILIVLLEDSEELKARYRRALSLALTSPRFRQILRNTPVGHIGKLTKLVAVAEESLTPADLAKLVETGKFERILALPQPSFDILAWSENPENVFAWAELSGQAILEVVGKRLYRIATPDHFKDPRELYKALSLNDTETLEWILQLTPDDRSFLLSELESEHIMWLAAFKSGLPDKKTILLARSIDSNAAIMSELEIREVGKSLKDSPIFEPDLGFLSARAGEPKSLIPITPMLMAANSAITGELSWTLFQHYYMVTSLILITGLVVAIVLIVLGWWLLRRRRPE